MTARVKADRRADILAAARAVFAEKGLEAAKVSDIVARAGVAQGTFYLYFPSKTSLVAALNEEVLTKMLAAIREAVESRESFADQIDAMVRTAFAAAKEYQDVTAVLQTGVGLLEKPEEWDRYLEPFQGYAEAFLEHGISTGEADPALEVPRTARLLVVTVNAAIEDCHIYQPSDPAEAYVANLVRFLQRALLAR